MCVAEEDVVEANKQARLLERDASKCGFLPDLNAGSQSRMEGIEWMRCVLREVKDGHTHTRTQAPLLVEWLLMGTFSSSV